MIIKYENLINILDLTAALSSDTGSPKDALAIKFVGETKPKHKETLVFDTVDNKTLLVDIDEEERVMGIEIV